MGRRSRAKTIFAVFVLVAASLVISTGAAAAQRSTTHIFLNHKSIHLGKTARIHGYIRPKQAGDHAKLQLLSGGAWRTIQQHRLGSRARYSFTVRPKQTGTKVYRVVDPHSSIGKPSSHSSRVTLVVRARAQRNCTPGYSPCIPPGPDVDCAGGSGDGPRYVEGPVYVTGDDPYGLDADHDGVACES